MNERGDMISRISDVLGDRQLIWAGLRSDDIDAITDLPQLVSSFSILGRHDRCGPVQSVDFERLWGARMDVDAWDMDSNMEHPAVPDFLERLLYRLSEPSALLPYRPTRALSSIAFARRDRCLYLGLFSQHQAVFDHKPWVEVQVADRLEIPVVEWSYVANEERRFVEYLLEEGPVMIRPSRSSGGAGLVRVDSPDELEASWPHQPDSFASVARFLEQPVPVNVGATVWVDGVTVSHPSIQLIGIPGCTTRPYGYCGNDYDAVGDLGAMVIDQIEESTSRLGRWLREHGYLGSFGADFLVHEGVPRFIEINPRFQGSTHASAQLSVEAGESCLFLDHIGAHLRFSAPDRPSLRATTASLPAFAHVVVHAEEPTRVVDAQPLIDAAWEVEKVCRVDVTAPDDIPTEPGGVVARITARDRMTDDGFSLTETWASLIEHWADAQDCEGCAANRDGGER